MSREMDHLTACPPVPQLLCKLFGEDGVPELPPKLLLNSDEVRRSAEMMSRTARGNGHTSHF